MEETEIIWNGPKQLKQLLVPTDSLHPDPNNARNHNERSYEAIKSAYAQFGQMKPIVIDSFGKVVAGNGQLEAAKRLGWTHIAAVDAGQLSNEQLKAYALADNRTAELSSWNFEILSENLIELKNYEFDLVDEFEFNKILKKESNRSDDNYKPSPSKKTKTMQLMFTDFERYEFVERKINEFIKERERPADFSIADAIFFLLSNKE